MTPEKDAQLCSKYPKIFRDRNGSPQETCMCWGFECGDGWFDLIDVLCSNIQNHVEHLCYGKTPEEYEEFQVVAAQVKEKFGGLRFYVDGADDEVRGMVRMAESMSYKVCEDCGAKGSARKGSWIRTMCDPCAETWSQRRAALLNKGA